MRSNAVHRPPPSGTGDRGCTRSGCPDPAVATLTYVYATSTAVVGPLAAHPEPHAYDLCAPHARGLTAPRGWELVRHAADGAPPPPADDLAALVEAVREVRDEPADPPAGGGARPPGPGRGRHLRLVPPST